MPLLSKLFGPRTAPAAPAVKAQIIEGYSVTPNPAKEASGWRIGARIEKDGRVHQLIRADTIGNHDDAVEASLAKAEQMIEQMGERMFD